MKGDTVPMIQHAENQTVWQYGDRPIIVRTASGAEYCVHANGLVSGGKRKILRRPLIGMAKKSGGTYYRGMLIMIGFRMVIDADDIPPLYTSPVTHIFPNLNQA
jgi:hypothetical protein